MTSYRSFSAGALHRAKTLAALFNSVEACQASDLHVMRYVFDQSVRRAAFEERLDPFVLPVPVRVDDLKGSLPGMSAARIAKQLEKLRKTPPLFLRQDLSLSTAEGQGIPLIDIVRAEQQGTQALHAAWWVRMGLWSRWGLNELERSFMARALQTWFRAPSAEVAHTIRSVTAQMAASSKDLALPHMASATPPRVTRLGDESVGRWPENLLLAVHLLEEAGLLVCPADVRRPSRPKSLGGEDEGLGIVAPLEPGTGH